MDRSPNFAQLLSPVSLSLCSISGYMSWIVIFRPSLFEMVLLVVVDMVGTLLPAFFDKPLFYRVDPQSKLYFPKVDYAAIERLDYEGKRNLFDSLVKFPGRRAWHICWMSFVKGIPLYVLAVFFWQHEGVSNTVQFVKALATTAMTFSYFYAASLIEKHMVASEGIATFHRLYDWGDVFKQVDLSNSRDMLNLKDRIATFSIWMFVLAIESLILTTRNPTESYPLIVEIGFVTIIGLLMSWRIWYLERKYFVGSLEKLFLQFERFSPAKREVLALHTTPILARFEKTFNELNARLESYERELSGWIVAKTEESRYTALGEIAGLVVHDLSSPLHVINFCTRQLKENPQLASNARYLDQLSTNGERSLELITSIRSYLKSSKNAVGTADFGTAIESARKLCNTRFFTPQFEKIAFHIDPALTGINVKMSRPNLIHVLLNLLSNSIENLIEHSIPSPKVAIMLKDPRGVFHIMDNGTGLTVDQFEGLTAFAYLPQPSTTQTHTGLGMKLVRRLVEQHGGTLKVIDVPGHLGTVFELVLSTQLLVEEPPKGASHGG